EHSIGITPQPVLLELILEFDAERSREHRQVVLDRDPALGFESADHALAAMVNPGQRIRARGSRSLDFVSDEAVPDVLAQGGGNGGRTRATEAGIGVERNDA